MYYHEPQLKEESPDTFKDIKKQVYVNSLKLENYKSAKSAFLRSLRKQEWWHDCSIVSKVKSVTVIQQESI